MTGEALVNDSSLKLNVFLDGHPVSHLYFASIRTKVVSVSWMRTPLPGHFDLVKSMSSLL